MQEPHGLAQTNETKQVAVQVLHGHPREALLLEGQEVLDVPNILEVLDHGHPAYPPQVPLELKGHTLQGLEEQNGFGCLMLYMPSRCHCRLPKVKVHKAQAARHPNSLKAPKHIAMVK